MGMPFPHTGSPAGSFAPSVPLRLLLFLAWLPCLPLQGQTLYGGLQFGSANYQGELKDHYLTFRGTKPAFGAGLHYASNERLAFSAEFLKGRLEGHDRYNSFYYTRRRNLHFETDVLDLSLQARLNLNVSPGLPVIPYLSTGLAVFHVDPYTFDGQGARVYLYPLSTEGQGLSAYPDRPLDRRTRVSIPMTGGVELRLTRNLRADMELSIRRTFTDRIDDVSGTYPDGYLLLRERGPIAHALSYRADELPGEEPSFPAAGTPRGNPATNDWYYFMGLRLRHTILTREYRYDHIRQIIHPRGWPYRW